MAATPVLAQLNPAQSAAARAPLSSSLVLAGAGSGKTTVLMARAAHLVAEGVLPSQIMLATFANRAAEELRRRVGSALPDERFDTDWCGTFHGLAHRILRLYSQAAGLPANFALMDDDAQSQVMRSALIDLGLAGKAAPDGAPSAREALRIYNRAKSERAIGAALDIPADAWPGVDLAPVFSHYDALCAQQGLLDFHDLLERSALLLRSSPEVRHALHTQVRAVLVDEFQDINLLQYEWLKLACGPGCIVTAVGDDDQSIYSFRGASPGLMRRFVSDFLPGRDRSPGASPEASGIYRLETNYRSSAAILATANAVIAPNEGRFPKTLRPARTDAAEPVALCEFGTGAQEAEGIANAIATRIAREGARPSSFCVLYRTNSQSREVEAALLRQGIPVTVHGGGQFYRRAEVKTALAYLELCSDIGRDAALVRALATPPRGIGERTVDELRAAASAGGLSILATIGARSQEGAASARQTTLEAFAGEILDLAEEAQKLPLSALLGRVFERTGLLEHYGADASEGSDRVRNLDELLGAVRQFETDHPPARTAAVMLPEYLAFVRMLANTHGDTLSAQGSVALMTVHAAKGLEFDHVFVAGLEEGLFPHSAAVTAEREAWADDCDDPCGIEEERRLLYVALTRARHSVMLSHAKMRMQGGRPSFPRPSRFFADLPAKHVQAVPPPPAAQAEVVTPARPARKGGSPQMVGRTRVRAAPSDKPPSLAAKPTAPPPLAASPSPAPRPGRPAAPGSSSPPQMSLYE